MKGLNRLSKMRKIILLLLLLTFCQVGRTQIIEGTILDQTGGIKISFASVYLNGTSVGTYSDQNGDFKLDITKYSSMPLTISALGYYSVTLSDFAKDIPVMVHLAPKIFELNEVVINSKAIDKERIINLRLFRNEFLGTTDNANKCEIINEKDIAFNYGSDKDTLKAFASHPIIIYNNALGYKITYYLDKFEYYKKSKSFFYKGSTIFSEDSTSEKTQKQFFERRRRYSYLGSRIQFFRSLWANNLNPSGFSIKNPADEILGYNNIVVVDDSLKKFLTYKGDLKISYYSKFSTSYIEFLKDSVYFDSNGYFDASGIIWEGQMARQRIGDLLPYEYKIK